MRILGIRVDNVDMETSLARIGSLIGDYQNNKTNHAAQIITLNAEGVYIAAADAEFAAIIEQADLVTPDGRGVLWAANKLGQPLKERVTGIDLLEQSAALAAQKGWSVYLLGSVDGVALEAAEQLTNRYPQLQIAGTHHGYFRGHDQDVIADINVKRPDLLFVGLGMPMQEKWLARFQQHLHVAVTVGVGGSFDVVAGHIKRAPVFWQKMGLEWLWRLLKEPQRIGRAMVLPRFMIKILKNK